MRGSWYGPVATTTWSAVSVPAVVAIRNPWSSRVARTPSTIGTSYDSL
ncbi:hypothetical protein OG555_06665 [Kribbella sp. NBC_01484]|nr:hypothetical protein [Kribbella sp. NBC_01484]